jgi:hypothetical protein
MLGCADPTLLSYYHDDLSATEVATHAGCSVSLRLLGSMVNSNAMRSFEDGDAAKMRCHPVIIASGLANETKRRDCLAELFAQMDDAERKRWPMTLQVLQCKACGTRCASISAWRAHKCTDAVQRMVTVTGSTGRMFRCLLCAARHWVIGPELAPGTVFQHIIDRHASDEKLPFTIVPMTVPEFRKRKRDDQ